MPGEAYSEPLSDAGLKESLTNAPETSSVAGFVPSEHIRRLETVVDVERLRAAADETLRGKDNERGGLQTRNVTRRPGVTEPTIADLSGRYWMRDAQYIEEPFDPIVDETAYTEIEPDFVNTYVAEVVEILRSLAPVGRVRLLGKDPYTCNSWHRYPEPRFHIPIVANPGSLFVVNHHATHLPADGSIYFTDTRGYHTAMNGGNEQRLSLVAVIAISPTMS